MVSSFHFVNSPLLQTGNGWDLKITQGFCCKRQCGYNLYSFNLVHSTIYSSFGTDYQYRIICNSNGAYKRNQRNKSFPYSILPSKPDRWNRTFICMADDFNSILQNYSKTIVSSEWSAFWGLIAVVCWQQIGYMMIIYIAGIQNIPGELIEAAKLMEPTDGSS